MSDHVIVNISGHRFCISRRGLRRFPNTRLAQLFLRETGGSFGSNSKLVDYNKQQSGHEYFFDRNPAVFAGIMDLYRSGSIHIPPGACWILVQEELSFWQVDPGRICRSCQLLLADQINRQKELYEMQHTFGDDTRRMSDGITALFKDGSSHNEHDKTNYTLSVKEQLVAFFREPSSTKTRWTQAYKYVFTSAVFVYVLIYILETEDAFRTNTGDCKQFSNLSSYNSSDDTNPIVSLQSLGIIPDNWFPPSSPEKVRRRMAKYFTSKPSWAMFAIDMVCLFFFTVDFFLRFALAPKPRITFLKSSSAITDIIITIANALATLLVWAPQQSFNCNNGMLISYLTLEIFRVARLTRLLQFTSRYNGIRVLILSLGGSLQELLLLLSGLLVAVVVFGMTIYVSEIAESKSDYENFTHGFWWALVTMTTVGYGDYTPKSEGGMLVGALCAIGGVLYVALQMPVIANRFNALYIYAREQERKLNETHTIIESSHDAQQPQMTRF